MKTLFLSLLLVILIVNHHSAFGVSANTQPVEIIQPDGTRITIIPKGDEHMKWAQTTDGYSIMRNSKGLYEYTRLSETMDMVPSGVQVRNVTERTMSEVQFLRNTAKGMTYSQNQFGMMKNILQMSPKNHLKGASTTGTKKFVCILIGFTDKAFTKTKEDFENLFNQIGYNTDGATGSVNDFYRENSYNQLNISVTVAGPYTAMHNMAYYGANDANGHDVNPQALVTEALILADPAVNYADFDNDRDGTVDGVFVIHAGYGEEAGAADNAIWSHQSTVSSLTLDGMYLGNYSCSPELRGVSGSGISRIGTICHELGHILGAVDYYDVNYSTEGKNDGTGNWDLMGNGVWNNNGATPAHHNPYNKIFVYGWAVPKKINPGDNIVMNDAEKNNNSFYIINTATPNEFFLCENRQKQNFDSYIPGHGLVIYHIDGNYINSSEYAINTGSHQGMYPVCANAQGLPPTTYGIINSDGLPFPGADNKTSFTDTTIPNSQSWSSAYTYMPITGILENSISKTISFTSPILPNRPVAISAVSATNILQTSFDANWNLIATATGYRLDVATDPDFTSLVSGWNNINVGNVKTFHVTGLLTGSNYFYRIRPFNTGGISDNSNTVTLKTLIALPATPFGLTAVSCSNLVTLKWSKNSDPNFLKYRIYGSLANKQAVRMDSTYIDRYDTTHIFSELTHGLTYSFQVVAVSVDGTEIAFSNNATSIVKTGLIPVIKMQSDKAICANPVDSITSYQWYKANTIILNSNQPYCTTNKMPGAYSLVTIDRYGCLNTSNSISTVANNSLTIYPNPASVSFSLKLKDAVDGDTYVSVINSAGIKVMEFHTDKANIESLREIPVDNLNSGIYIVQATLNQKDVYSSKLMVIK